MLQGVAGVPQEARDQLEACYWAAHYLTMHTLAAQHGWAAVAAKAATSLLRFTAPISVASETRGSGGGVATGGVASVVPVDKALYLAGTAWQQARTFCLMLRAGGVVCCGHVCHFGGLAAFNS
jgi:hypothetical protein